MKQGPNKSTRSVDEWLAWLETLHPSWMELGLERVGQVAQRLALTHFSCPVITVTGTNGKGSTVALLESIYRAAGYRVGTYSSPHLVRFNERIRVAGQDVDDATLCQSFAHIEAARHDISLTYFEFTTLAALDIFQRAHLDVLILEVGLGGRLDATNLIDADVAVITTIALDHQAWLGDNRDSIGYEKAGIMRAGRPVVCGDPEPPQSVLQKAAELEAPLYILDLTYSSGSNETHFSGSPLPCNSFSFSHSNSCGRGLGRGLDQISMSKQALSPSPSPASERGKQELWSFQSPLQTYIDLPIPRIELQNAATALMTLQLLEQRLPVSLAAVTLGLQQVFVAGRFQCIAGEQHLTVLDVAHNPAGGAWLAHRLQQESTSTRVIAVWAMLADKDLAATVRPLVPWVTTWFTGELNGVARAADSPTLGAALLSAGAKHYQTFSDFAHAYQAALSYVQQGDTLLVFGSFHTVAYVLQHLNSGGG